VAAQSAVGGTHRRSRKDNTVYHVMVLPAAALVLLFCYLPMAGVVMAFQDFNIGKGIFGSKFVGLDNFIYLFKMRDTPRVIFNTFYIALLKFVLGLFVSLAFAILLNEVARKYLKRTVQTIVFLPYFISWVLLAGIFVDILSPSSGIINHALAALGVDPVFFLGNPKAFPWVIIVTAVWKNFGFGSIIFLAALAAVDPSLHEAAAVDGANRWRRIIHVTIPCIAPTIAVVAILNLGGSLNDMFDQIYNLYSPITYQTGDVIDTFVYRLGLIDMQYGPAAAFGLFKSVVTLVMVSVSYYAALRYANYRVF